MRTTCFGFGDHSNLYPTELVVRNTFLHFNVEKLEATSSSFRLRRSLSAPCGRRRCIAGSMEGAVVEMECAPHGELIQHSEPTSKMASVGDDFVVKVALDLESLLAEPQPMHYDVQQPVASSWYPEPQLGSPELPTAGSAAHYVGHCKPCAFAWKHPGCGNGVHCQFCHICDASEKKRRQKEKRLMMRDSYGPGGRTIRIVGEAPERGFHHQVN